MRKIIGITAGSLAIVLLAFGPAAEAAVKPHALFTDNMVLQQGRKVPVWGKADPGEKVTLTFNAQEVSADPDKDGRWTAWLQPMKAGGPFDMTVRGQNTLTLKNVMIGEVWVCSGQSNMAFSVKQSDNAAEAIANSNNPMIRLFTVDRATSDVPLTELKGGPWVECGPQTVPAFSAVAYFFGRDLQAAIKVPVGLIHTSWGGTPAQAWTAREALESKPELKAIIDGWTRYMQEDYPRAAEAHNAKLARWKEAAAKAKQEGKKAPQRPRDPAGPTSPGRPSCLYNAMIHPLLPYAIQGSIWYQGEANAPKARQYRTLFPAMIQCWRKAWGQGDFPFLFVQLAPFERGVLKDTWPELREAQLLTAQTVPNTALAVITDLGERDNIHPRRKAPVGARLALAARAVAYGEKIVHSGPDYAGMKIEGDRVILNFKHVGSGLEARGGELKGFTIAGKDRQFAAAKADIRGDTIVISSPQVAEPLAVRYGWANYPEVNLYNKEGLPASPFRTDNFPSGPNEKSP
jgi:sialate O-acetylesterase